MRYRLSGIFGEDTRTIVSRLLKTDGRQHARQYAIAFVMMFLVAGTTGLTAYLMRDVINHIFVERNHVAVWILGGALIGLFLVKGLAEYSQAIILAKIGNKIIANYQRQLFDSTLAQGIPFFARQHSTDFLNRLNSGAAAARNILNIVVTSIGRDALTLTFLIAVMVVQEPVMAFFCLVIMPGVVLGIRKLIRRARQMVQRNFIGSGRVMQTMQETVQGIRAVKSYNLEDRMKARMDENIRDLEATMNKQARVASRTSPLMETLGGLAIGLFVMYAGYNVLNGARLPGEYFSAITALLLAYDPARRLARMNIDLAANLTMSRYLFDVLDSTPAEAETLALPALKVERGEIEFKGVTFEYRPGEPVLREVSFTAEAQQTTALVGSSGSGKSTIMSLIERFYEPTAGVISIDGQNIALHSRRSLRDQIAYVSQDLFLFSGTIRENIFLGRPGATEEEFIAASKAAHAHDFVMGFENGYDTEVGEHGAQLSGGQRARISIARAFLKNAPILLLDEPTAALDAESEMEVQRALDDLRKSRTTILIAHRLHTVLTADKICVVDGGNIVETGTHQELLARRGRYHAFYRLQFDERNIANG
ncbi:MAG TPA: ABC transporter ATP-binding protein [Xanthobacteraceae bacterium]|nr:ABC transporter ATP-binding protein [Xanthobacteraceae bacterium]